MIFERIHVLPATRTYPFILSSQHLNVEVWNAYRAVAQTVTDIIETGPAGVSIVTPHAVPIVFAPMQSRTYDILVSASGAPRAANTIRWDFAGIGEPLLTLTGLRLLPFTIAPDWETGLTEEVIFSTDVMTAYDSSEQRMMLRTIPNRTVSFNAMALDDLESSLLMALLWTWQARSYGVMMWMNASPLLAGVAINGQDILVDTTQMHVVVGDTIILWSGPFTWFASAIESLTAGSIRMAAASDQDFTPSTTIVAPIILGRVADSVPVIRPSNASAAVSIKFDLDVVAAADSAPV
jgi:hypothetical protein